MKIAICISGQLRTWEKCYKSWMGLFDLELLKQIKLGQFQNMGLQASAIQKMKKRNILFRVPTTPCDPPDTSRPKWSRTPIVDFPLPMILDLNLNDSIACYNECVSNPKIEIDYFVHTWDYNSPSDVQGHKKTQKVLTKLELDEFKNIVKPKKILIEGRKVSHSKIHWGQGNRPLLGYARSMLYAMFKVAELKKQYEKENNFEYDVCVRIRPDLFFDEGGIRQMLGSFNIPRDNFIHTVHCGYDGEFPYFYAGDIFYYANSKTYDIISDLYNRIGDIDVKLFEKEMGPKLNGPDLITIGGKRVGKNKEFENRAPKTHGETRMENLFAYYLMDNNITVRALPGGPYCTGSSIFLDNPEDRKRMKKYGF